jgi:hypothetical protein
MAIQASLVYTVIVLRGSNQQVYSQVLPLLAPAYTYTHTQMNAQIRSIRVSLHMYTIISTIVQQQEQTSDVCTSHTRATYREQRHHRSRSL